MQISQTRQDSDKKSNNSEARCTSPTKIFASQRPMHDRYFEHVFAPRREIFIARPRFERSVLHQNTFSAFSRNDSEKKEDVFVAAYFEDRALSFKRKFEEMIGDSARDQTKSTPFSERRGLS
jgi:hypothetical protein